MISLERAATGLLVAAAGLTTGVVGAVLLLTIDRAAEGGKEAVLVALLACLLLASFALTTVALSMWRDPL